jgi:hypothetical protein
MKKVARKTTRPSALNPIHLKQFFLPDGLTVGGIRGWDSSWEITNPILRIVSSNSGSFSIKSISSMSAMSLTVERRGALATTTTNTRQIQYRDMTRNEWGKIEKKNIANVYRERRGARYPKKYIRKIPVSAARNTARATKKPGGA